MMSTTLRLLKTPATQGKGNPIGLAMSSTDSGRDGSLCPPVLPDDSYEEETRVRRNEGRPCPLAFLFGRSEGPLRPPVPIGRSGGRLCPLVLGTSYRQYQIGNDSWATKRCSLRQNDKRAEATA